MYSVGQEGFILESTRLTQEFLCFKTLMLSVSLAKSQDSCLLSFLSPSSLFPFLTFLFPFLLLLFFLSSLLFYSFLPLPLSSLFFPKPFNSILQYGACFWHQLTVPNTFSLSVDISKLSMAVY